MSKRRKRRPGGEPTSGGGAPPRAVAAASPLAGHAAATVPEHATPVVWRVLLAVVCAILVFLVFLPTLGFEFVDWDDRGLLTENPHWRGLGWEQIRWMFTTNHWGHYQPVTWLTYGLDHVLWGMDPRGVHLTNTLFHAANTFLVWFVASFLLGAALPALRRDRPWLLDLAATFAALTFGVHPLRVESVAWATERRDLVSAFFILLTLLAYLRSSALAGRRRTAWLIGSLVLYLISMLSKVGGAPLPLVFLVLEWYPLGRLKVLPGGGLDRAGRRVLLGGLPFLVIAIGFSIATVKQQAGRWLIPLAVHDYLARTAQSFYGLVFYAWKTFLPTGLSPLYEIRFPLDPFAPRFLASALVVLVAAVAVLKARRRAPAVAAAALTYALFLGPLLGYFQNGPQLVADRYSYLSTLGFILLVAGGAASLAYRRPAPVRLGAIAAAASLCVAACAGLTVRQEQVWRDTATLWASMLRHDPSSSFANNSYGYVLLQKGDVETAEAHFRKALAINPGNREAQFNLSEALKRKGVDGVEAYRAALAFNPEVASLRNQLGNELLKEKRNEEAVETFLEALRLEPRDPRFHANLAIALQRLDRLEQARQHYEAAVALDPTLWIARDGLASVLARQGKTEEARRTLEKLLQENPGYEPARRRLASLR